MSIGVEPINGHAIQCRIYAEDPETFIPSPGMLDVFRLPELDGLRVETGFREGDEVSSHFDPLLAKLIAWGADAGRRYIADGGCAETDAGGGVKSNVAALEKAMRHADFRRGRYNTGLMGELR